MYSGQVKKPQRTRIQPSLLQEHQDTRDNSLWCHLPRCSLLYFVVRSPQFVAVLQTVRAGSDKGLGNT